MKDIFKECGLDESKIEALIALNGYIYVAGHGYVCQDNDKGIYLNDVADALLGCTDTISDHFTFANLGMLNVFLSGLRTKILKKMHVHAGQIQQIMIDPIVSNYWKKRCRLAEKFIKESPDDPDLTKEQGKAYLEWLKFKQDKDCGSWRDCTVVKNANGVLKVNGFELHEKEDRHLDIGCLKVAEMENVGGSHLSFVTYHRGD